MDGKDVELIGHETPFQGYFRVDRYVLRHRLHSGAWGAPITREVFERGHAAAVLLHDPARDCVVLTEQFRMGPFVAGENPWMLDIVAGIVDPGEAVEDVARRECVEEAGAHVGALTPICRIYVSPGGTSETIHLYYAPVDSTGLGGVHGLADEGEDIKVVVMRTEAALAALAQGRIEASPAVVALQWLALNRQRLRGE